MAVYSISAASTAITNLNNLNANKMALVKEQRAEIFRRVDAEARTESMIEKKLIHAERQERMFASERVDQKRLQQQQLPQNSAAAADLKTPANGLTRNELRPGSMRYQYFRELQNPNLVQPSDDSSTVGAWLDETV
jgi:hypothetical protein